MSFICLIYIVIVHLLPSSVLASEYSNLLAFLTPSTRTTYASGGIKQPKLAGLMLYIKRQGLMIYRPDERDGGSLWHLFISIMCMKSIFRTPNMDNTTSFPCVTCSSSSNVGRPRCLLKTQKIILWKNKHFFLCNLNSLNSTNSTSGSFQKGVH